VAPLRYQAKWDLSGVQVAAVRQQISKLGVFLDPAPERIEEALAWGADFLLCHHPLTLDPHLPNRVDTYHAALKLALTNDIWLYAAHTSLDANIAGPVSWLSEALGLTGNRAIEQVPAASVPEDRQHLTGFGIIGSLEEPLSVPDFQARLRQVLTERTGRGFWLASGNAPERISKVAYCPGSGGSLMDKAFDQGADVFLTGEVKHHQAVYAPGLVADVGHHGLEEEMMRLFAEKLTETLSPLGVTTAFFPSPDPMRLEAPAPSQAPAQA
jgi:dinuclear metal center YbgI/SA1388 family protein